MQEATAAVQQIPPTVGMDFEDRQVVLPRPEELAVQCAVFVGNYLTNKQMRLANYRLGGKLFPFPDFYTVPNGIVARCAITRLKKGYRSVHKNHIKEDQWPQWLTGYTLKNQWDPVTRSFVDIEVGKDNDLLYKDIAPIREIKHIAKFGVVMLDADCGINTAQDIKDAQFHYFPNWLEILTPSSNVTLPVRLAELEDHLRNRQAQAHSDTLRAIGDKFLQSANEYRDAAAEYIAYQTAAIKETEGKAGGSRYDDIAERMFVELDLTREDKLHVNFARQQVGQEAAAQQMATAVSLLTQIVAGQQAQVPVEQAPAPVTQSEAMAEVERSVAEEPVIETGFTDMSDATAEVDEPALVPETDEIDKYLAQADESKTVDGESGSGE